MTSTTIYVHLKPTERVTIERDSNDTMWMLSLGDIKVLLADWAGWDLDGVAELLGRLHDELLALQVTA